MDGRVVESVTTAIVGHSLPQDPLERLDKFKEYLFEQGLNPATIASYVTDVRQFHEYFAEMAGPNAMPPTRLHITRYRTHLLDLRLKVATINKKINSLAAYDRYLLEKGVLKSSIVHPRRDRIAIAVGSERKVEVLTDEEVTRILFHTQQPSFSLRNRLIVEMLLYTGLRVSELCDIQLADVDLLTHTLKVTGKGATYREIPLKPELAALLKKYLRTGRKESRFPDSPYLLVSQRAPRLHRDAINRLLRRLGDQLGVRAYPHKFRHTFCTNLLRRGVPLTTVAKLAGHASIQTTSQFYIHTARKDMENAVNLL